MNLNNIAAPQMESLAEYLEPVLRTKKGPLRILEWGSGSSTIYFAHMLSNRSIDFKWISVEHNKEWYEQVTAALEKYSNAQVVYIDLGEKEGRWAHTHMNEYVNYPGQVNEKFDFIIVDGRYRRRCILNAKNFLAAGGEVLLHDAFRPYYWSAFRVFPDSRFVHKDVWRGRLENPGAIVLLKNMTINSVYKMLHLFRYMGRRLRGTARRVCKDSSK